MKKVKESTFGELIAWLRDFGWDKGIKLLEDNLRRTEWVQAHLFGEGDPKSIREANKMSHSIIKMQMTLIRLNQVPKSEQSAQVNDTTANQNNL